MYWGGGVDVRHAEIAIRPRTTWEALDLGLAMARRWWRPLWAIWLVTALPCFVVGHVVFMAEPVWALVFFWWCKPLFEQLPLVYLSRVIFGDGQRVRDVLSTDFAAVFRQLPAVLIWRRVGLSRSFTAPVVQLERLGGPLRRQRLAVLQHDRGGGGFRWFTLQCLLAEAVVFFSVTGVLVLLAPRQFDGLAGTWPLLPGISWQWLVNGVYLVAAGLVAPFFVAGGFALYLNRRIELEAWDLELKFRSLRQRWQHRPGRLGGTVVVLVAAGLAGGMAAGEAAAEPVARVGTPEAAREVIQAVLSEEDFGRLEKRWQWRLRDRAGSGEVRPGGWWHEVGGIVARFIEALLGGLLVAAVVMVLFRWRRNRRRGRIPPPLPGGGGETVTGVPVDAPAPLCLAEVPETVWRLFRHGSTRPALSLLYRASLSALEQGCGVCIGESLTEGECLALGRRHLDRTACEVMVDVVRCWQRYAYGGLPPDEAQFQALLQRWGETLGAGGR